MYAGGGEEGLGVDEGEDVWAAMVSCTPSTVLTKAERTPRAAALRRRRWTTSSTPNLVLVHAQVTLP